MVSRFGELEKANGNPFLWALLIATSIPVFVILAIQHVFPSSDGFQALFVAILFLGSGAHVASSSFFYWDPDARSMLSQSPTRYFVAPIVIIVTLSALFAFGSSEVRASLTVLYFIWQTHHYTRQNLGILSFASRATQTAPPSVLEQSAVLTAGVGGVLGMITLQTPYASTILDGYAWEINAMAVLVYGAAGVLLLVSIPNQLKERSIWRFLFFVLGVVFYLPTFLFKDVISAILTYAIAHGIQYLVFMFYVAGRNHSTASLQRRLVTLSILTLGGAALLEFMQRSIWGSLNEAIFGAYLALVITHFIVDAGVWRLREATPRAYMRERFRFL